MNKARQIAKDDHEAGAPPRGRPGHYVGARDFARAGARGISKMHVQGFARNDAWSISKIYVQSLALVTAMACLLAGCGSAEKTADKSGTDKTGSESRPVEEKSGSAHDQQAVKVQTIQVTLEDVTPHLVLTGVVGALPDRLAKVTPAIPGKLKRVLVVEGQKVNKGDLIAVLDDTHLSEQLNQADANVRAGETAIKQAEEAVSFARDNVERQTKLFQAEVSAKKEILTAQNQLQTAQLQVQTAQAQLQATKASRAQITTELTLTRVKAPITGVVANRYLNSNDSVDTNAAIVQIVGLDTVLISAALPADWPEQLSIGQKAKISSESEPQKQYDSTITSISPMVDRVSNTIATQLICANSAGRLRDGQNVKVTIAARNISRAILVPQEALVPDPDAASEMMVYVVDAGQAKRVKIKRGLAQNGKVQITSGLKPGDTVIVQGAYGLPDGSPVIPVAAK